jgi:hypothetical protein
MTKSLVSKVARWTRRVLWIAVIVISFLVAICLTALCIRSYLIEDALEILAPGKINGLEVSQVDFHGYSSRAAVYGLLDRRAQIGEDEFDAQDDLKLHKSGKISHWRMQSVNILAQDNDHQLLGFGFSYHSEQFPSGNDRFVALRLPLPPLILLFWLAPLWMIWKLSTRLRRPAPGTCAFCGYNLRATPNRCPECGNENRAQV